MNPENWPWDAFNMAVLGKTQSGKTSVVRQIHDQTNRLSIWLNEQGDDRVPGVAGKQIAGPDALLSGMQNDRWKFNWVSRNRKRDIQRLQSLLWNIADRTNREFPMQVIVDEAHRLAPQTGKKDVPGRDTVRRFAKEGVKRNIKFIGITQDPVAIDKQALRQSEYRLVFDMSAENRSAVSDYGFDWAAIDDCERFAGVAHAASGQVIEAGVKAEGKYAT